ncbi:hypothetical protein [Micromonospora sp. NPDC047740]|uniref:hypothetical protein n=1 Tax=Micromonospora sp. NPDC047740 TaxID=3364254 RepID=UPI003710E67F
MPAPRTVGLGHLALAVFVQSWNRGGEGAVEHLRRYAEWAQDATLHLRQCADDANCLLASGLDPGELESLWCWCTGGSHRPGRDGLDGREWLATVSAILAPEGHPAHRPHSDDPAAAARVAQVVDAFQPAPDHESSLCPLSTVDARRILRRLIDSGHADLTMRLFLALAAATFMPISPAIRDEIASTSRDLGHPDHFLEEIDGL